jgi:hydrogenase assembly chaperone HypC/HupF
MCIGQTLQVQAMDGSHAWCRADGERAGAEGLEGMERVDMALVGAQPAGTWVLAFMGAARRVLDAEQAAQARDARRALAAVLSGRGDVDTFFADLVNRSPTLPPHLSTKAAP